MEFAAILIENRIFNRERDFWQPRSMEFAPILIEKEIFGNGARSIDRSTRYIR